MVTASFEKAVKELDFHSAIIMSLLTAFSLIVGLFWKDTIQTTLNTILPQSENLIYRYITAFSVTILLVIVAYALMHSKNAGKILNNKLKNDIKKSSLKKSSTISRREAALFALCFILLAIVYVLSNILNFAPGIIMGMSGGCDNINLFYTNTSFDNDVTYVITYLSYNVSFWRMQNIRNAYESEQGDCKDISKIIYCLSLKYNKTCKLYSAMTTDPRILEMYNMSIVGHIGVSCYEEGKWEKYY